MRPDDMTVNREVGVVLLALINDTDWDSVLVKLDNPIVQAVMSAGERADVEKFKRRLYWLRSRLVETGPEYRRYIRARAEVIINGS